MVYFKYLSILKNRNRKKCRLFIQEINVYFSYYSLTAKVYTTREKNFFFVTEIVLVCFCNSRLKIYSLIFSLLTYLVNFGFASFHNHINKFLKINKSLFLTNTLSISK